MNQIHLNINREEIANKVEEALQFAEECYEGRVVIQLLPTNDDILISHQLGNSWEGMGLNARESEDRILQVYDCREFEVMYWEDEEETEKNRILPCENSNYDEEVEDILTAIESFVLSRAEENSEIIY